MGRTGRRLECSGEGPVPPNRPPGGTGTSLECWERVRWGEQDGEDRKEVRVPGEGQVGGT